MMTEYRNNLLTRIIKIYGFEHEATLEFAAICEEWTNDEAHDKILEMLVESHEEEPMLDEDED